MIRKTTLLPILVALCISITSFAQVKTENVIIVTLDGMRWQEVFGGADSALLKNKKYTKDSIGTRNKFWLDDVVERRKKLFPFLWNIVANNGQIHGNRKVGSKVNVANKYLFSYPGYNEILTGYPDTAINSNNKVLNNNINVLEFINQQKNYAGKVVAFSTWDVFPYIINKWRSGIYVNADTDTLRFNNKNLQLINDMQLLTAKPIDVRPDLLTYFAAREYLKAYQPKVLYLAFDETDDFAHEGEYDQYLKSAHAQDAMIKDLWNTIETNPYYKNKTTLLITCDHGRGDYIKDNWRHHGQAFPESGQTWFAIMGPNIKATGEATAEEQIYQNQYAATIANLLGLHFLPNHPVGQPIQAVLVK